MAPTTFRTDPMTSPSERFYRVLTALPTLVFVLAFQLLAVVALCFGVKPREYTDLVVAACLSVGQAWLKVAQPTVVFLQRHGRTIVDIMFLVPLLVWCAVRLSLLWCFSILGRDIKDDESASHPKEE